MKRALVAALALRRGRLAARALVAAVALRRGRLAARALVAAVALPAVAHAGGYTFNDFGERRGAMHAVQGRPDEPTTIFHNPAGLAELRGSQVYLSVNQLFYGVDIRLRDSTGALHPPPGDEPLAPDRVYVVNPFLGFSTDLGRDDLGVGVALYAPVGIGAFFPENTPLRYHALEAYFVAGYATFAGAYRVTPELSLGAGFSIVHVRFKEERIVSLNQIVGGETCGDGYDDDNDGLIDEPEEPECTVYDQRFDESSWDSNLDYDLSAKGSDTTWGFTLGALAHPHRDVGVGVAFVSQVTANLGGEISLDSRANPGDTHPGTQTTDFVVPPGVRAGVNWQVAPWLEVGADYYVYFYDFIDSQTTRVAPDDPEDLLWTQVTIDDTGEIGIRTPKDNGLNQIVSGGLGFRVLHDRRFAKRLDAFVGAEYDRTPFSEEDFSLESPTRSFWGVSAGGRWTLSDRWRFGLAYWFEKSEHIDIRDSRGAPPANAVVDGGNHSIVLTGRFAF